MRAARRSTGSGARVLRTISVLLLGLWATGCSGNQYPTAAPDPRDPNLTWAQRHYVKKMQYQQMTNDRLP
jgi:hypothetical protein